MSRRINRAMTATLATLPIDIILSISAFLSNPLDLLSLSQTCRSAFLASQAWTSYWSKLVPAAHLPRPAPWQSYSPNELRHAHIRYAATRRLWESPSPTFKPPLRLPHPRGINGFIAHSQRWRSIRGTRWAWSLWHLTGEVSFCDLRAGLVIGKWNAGGPVIEAVIASRSPNECVLCHWRTNDADNISKFEIVATSITFEQESPISPTKLSFRTIRRVPTEGGTSLSNSYPDSSMVLWRDYLIGSFVRPQSMTHGLFLWSMTGSSVFYFEMGFVPLCIKVIDDLLFTTLDISDGNHWNTTFRCIHIPSLVISAQLPGGTLSLTEDAFAVLLPKCIMKSRAPWSLFSAQSTIYSVPTCLPTHPRYCFVIERFPGQVRGMQWEVLEVEIDLSIPGPIKVFSRVSQQYTVQRPDYPLRNSDDDLLLYLPLGRGGLPRASLGVRFLRVGKPGKGRLAGLGGVDKMRLNMLSVDRDAGYVILWAAEGHPGYTRDCPFIWWLDERKPGNMVYSRTKEVITSWSRGLLRRF